METRRQLLTYGAIGLASNGTLYALYLLLTEFRVGHKTAMTGLFILGLLWTYLGNRRLTFRHRGVVGQSAVRYAIAYLAAYGANVATLYWLVDIGGLPHRIVMLGLIITNAVMLFTLQKFWIFTHKSTPEGEVGRSA